MKQTGIQNPNIVKLCYNKQEIRNTKCNSALIPVTEINVKHKIKLSIKVTKTKLTMELKGIRMTKHTNLQIRQMKVSTGTIVYN